MDIKARNKEFVKNLIVKGMSKGRAYKEAMRKNRGDTTNIVTMNDYNGGYRLAKKDDVQRQIQAMRQRYVNDAPKAYEEQWKLAGSKNTPAHVKMSFYDKVQDRGGLAGVQLEYHRHEHKYPDLEKLSSQQLAAMILEPEGNRNKALAVKGMQDE